MDIEYRTEPEYWEYLDGEAHPKVSPRERHAVVQFKIGSLIAKAGEGIGKVGTEWDIRLPEREKYTKFIPDVSFFSFERLSALGEDRASPPCAPDVAVEVLSPGDSRIYLEKKIALYLTHGSIVVLDVDPIARTIRVCDRNATSTLLRQGEKFVHLDAPWLQFSVREVFAGLDDIPE